MQGDFQDWNNDPADESANLTSVVRSPHMSPPRVEIKMRADDRRRELRGKLLLAALACFVLVLLAYAWFRG